MTGLTRRGLLAAAAGAALLAGLPGQPAAARQADWIEVTGFATAAGPADRDAARRRALADALLSAALAGGAQVRGHSAMSMTRMTSDLLILRPLGQVLAHRILEAGFDGRIWRIRIAARVGQPAPGQCPDRRQLILLAATPSVTVSPNAPAWADVLGRDLAHHLLGLVADHPGVAQLTRAQGRAMAQPGQHGLQLDLRLTPEDRDLVMTLRMRLDGPGLDQIDHSHSARLRLPGPSVLGRAAPLVKPDRQAMAATLSRDARGAVTGFLDRAACRPPQARLMLADGALRLPLGRRHGLDLASLAFTADPDSSTEMLEITALSDTAATLRPLDPARPLAAFHGRAVRLMQMQERLP
jgi:hypothetical protein